MRLIVAVLLAAATAPVVAEPPPEAVPVPDAAPAPEPLSPEEALEPKVTITHRKGGTYEEYRINGRLYMVKVTPVVGPPYYLMDNDGDGQLETRMSELYSDFVVPKWVLFSW